MAINLSDAEKLALLAILKRAIAVDPFPLSPRVLTLEAVFAKLEELLPPSRRPRFGLAPAIGREPRCTPEPGAVPGEVRARSADDARRRRRGRGPSDRLVSGLPSPGRAGPRGA
jgi:hypothetical protein